MANFANLKNFQFLTLEVHSGKSTPENPTRPKTKSILDRTRQELKIWQKISARSFFFWGAMAKTLRF
jgi:hypothetical protein